MADDPNKYVDHQTHMHTVQAVLRLNKQMAQMQQVHAEIAANHSMLLNEMRSMMATMDDLDRRMAALTTAVSRSGSFGGTTASLLTGSRALKAEKRSSKSLTQYIQKGDLHIDGVSPDRDK